jgi:hypothetical protein
MTVFFQFGLEKLFSIQSKTNIVQNECAFWVYFSLKMNARIINLSNFLTYILHTNFLVKISR